MTQVQWPLVYLMLLCDMFDSILFSLFHVRALQLYFCTYKPDVFQDSADAGAAGGLDRARGDFAATAHSLPALDRLSKQSSGMHTA